MGPDVMKTDVFIVGGGPAGLATGIAIRQRGMRVMVADSAKPPIDKACGEGLMPQTVAALKGLGVTMGPSQAVPFRGIRFIGEGRVAEGAFPHDYGLGIRRTTLHQALADRAAEVGVEPLWGSRVKRILEGEVWLDSYKVQARWIIGADGQNSRVREWAGLDRGLPQETRFGFRQHFRLAPWTDFVEVYWGRNCQIVVTPVTPHEVCLVVTSRSPQIRLKEALTQFPEISRRLDGRQAITKDLGAISALRIIRKVSRGPFALVGDASGSVDSLTGEGLGLAFQQATALSEALASDDLAHYDAAHRRINRPPEIMSRILLAMEKRAWLRRRAIDALAKEPHLFERLLAVHAGTFSPRTLGFGNIFKLGWRLITSPN
ncbi:MAG: NAD(P)/FAD-dependent oxidoreductase [Acidobacteriota bacterium]|nr:NAD(P)/FAD-dependent oxidoreductase [Acidobacteriota bacterium]